MRKKTSERLTKMGVENFLPIQQEVHNWSDRRKVVDRVILPMMISVHVDPQEQKEVLTLSAISRYMVLRGEKYSGCNSRPTNVTIQIYARLFGRNDLYEHIAISAGRKNTCNKGAIGRTGRELVDMNGKSKVAVRLTMLGCACVDIPAGCVEPV